MTADIRNEMAGTVTVDQPEFMVDLADFDLPARRRQRAEESTRFVPSCSATGLLVTLMWRPLDLWASYVGRAYVFAIFPVLSGAYRVARAVLAVTAVLLLTAMYTPVADWLALPLIKVSVESRSDAIVLLTAWSSPDGLLNTSGVRRTMQAAALYETRIADTIVVSGRNRGDGAGPTARLMRDLLIKLHVPPEAVVLETESTNTHTSAVNVAKMAAERGWSLVTLVSDSTHMRRALAAFKHEGLDALPGGDARLDLRTAPGPYRLLQLEGIAYEWLGLAYYSWKRWI